MTTFQNLFADQGTFQYLSPYIIAEVGVNHANSMDLAKQMIREAMATHSNEAVMKRIMERVGVEF